MAITPLLCLFLVALQFSPLLALRESTFSSYGIMSGLPPLPEALDKTVEPFTDSYAPPKQCVHSIIDQGRCSSQPMVVSQVLSDRFCLKGINVELAAQDILSCHLHTCTDENATESIWRYAESSGLLTKSCYPYTSWTGFNYMCKYAKCENGREPWVKYPCAKGSVKHITSQNIANIKLEIATNGPVMAYMNVYLDFIYFKVGVYSHKWGQYLGRHTVRCYGFGMENNEAYWQCANTWSYNWGTNGIFKIRMREAGIEADIWTCSPDKPRLTGEQSEQ